MKITLSSSGKSAVLSGQVGADLFIDCRGIVNPFRDPALASHHGGSSTMQAWMKENNLPYVKAALDMIDSSIATAHTRSGGAGKDSIHVHFFCLAGQHRSPALKHVVAEYLSGNPTVTVEVK